jgi:hypothetical protein
VTVIPAAYLIDLYWARPREDIMRLEVRRIRNEPGYPVLLLLRGGGREYVIESHAIIGAVDTYAGLGRFSRRLRELLDRDGGTADLVITGHEMHPFRA